MRKLIATLLLSSITFSPATPSVANSVRPPRVPTDVDLSDGPTGPTAARQPSNPGKASGIIEVVVQLKEPSLAEVAVANGDINRRSPTKLARNTAQTHLNTLSATQSTLSAQLAGLGGKEVARLSKALNAIVLKIDAAQLPTIAGLPSVKSVRPVRNYSLDLRETVPYIGAAAAQANGLDGSGITVAVLDSGIDYTHKNLGGPGTEAAYLDAYGTAITDTKNTTRDGLFPTAKVIEGIDFVGETWPDGDRSEDNDPIDFEGHGTHVADIIAGETISGGVRTHVGVAPGAKLLAVKVCSAVATSCNGVALLKAIEYSLDPNNDGDMSDRVDVINMSLGSDYGQPEDDLSFASANAVKAGVIVVASAGNGNDNPYKVGTPSTQPEVISVAQTSVPSDKIFPITVNGSSVYGIWQGWSANPVAVTGVLTYSQSNTLGCNPFAPGSLSGQVVIIDRGTCNISVKVANAAAGGALAALIANNRDQGPGEFAPSFSFGGGDVTIAGYTIRRDEGSKLKPNVGATVSIDPAAAISIVGHMVASSSRGPSLINQSIKPDVGAPGASLSAEVGTGDGETAFGGTSGAAPMVSGAAAILRQKFPDLSVAEIKALLMNTAETEIYINKTVKLLAPITRIGGGEIRVNQALSATTAAWDDKDKTGSLSFGYQPSSVPVVLRKVVRVKNYSAAPRTYTIEPTFRYTNDIGGAVTVLAPSNITLEGGESDTFDVTVIVDPNKLPVWPLNGGNLGGSGYLLQDVEFDGYLNIADATDKVHLAWQVLPHRASKVIASTERLKLRNGQGYMTLANVGASNASVDVFALTGRSSRIPKSDLPKPGDNFAVIDLKYVGARLLDDETLQFAIHTFRQRPSPLYPAEFDIYIDVDGDAKYDYVVYNMELGGYGATGQGVVSVANLKTNESAAYYFVGADFNSANMIMTLPLSALGISKDTKITFSVYAFDNFFTGEATDGIENMTFTPSKPRYTVTGIPETGLPAGSAAPVMVNTVDGGNPASPAQSGLLVLLGDGTPDAEAIAISVRK